MEYIKELYDSYFPKMNTESLCLVVIISLTAGMIGYLILRIMADRMAGTKAVVCAILSVYYYIILLSTVYTREYRKPQSKLELFWTYKAALAGDTTKAELLVLNILLFVPIGFCIGIILYKIINWSGVAVIWISLLASVVIEIQQFRLGRGLCEYDDVINNTLGAFIGYVIFRIIMKVYGIGKKIRKRTKRISHS